MLVCHRGTTARKYLLQYAKYPREHSYTGGKSSSDNIPIISLCVLLTPSQQCGCEPLQEEGARCQGAVLYMGWGSPELVPASQQRQQGVQSSPSFFIDMGRNGNTCLAAPSQCCWRLWPRFSGGNVTEPRCLAQPLPW